MGEYSAGSLPFCCSEDKSVVWHLRAVASLTQ